MKNKIGIIGCGNMGSAMAKRLAQYYDIWVADRDINKTKALIDSGLKLHIAASNTDLVKKTEIVILAVKPQDFSQLLNEIKGCVDNKLIISIAAGIPISKLEDKLGKVKIIRAMPNLPAQIGKGMICLSQGKHSTDEDLSISEEIFKNLGTALIIDERMMPVATAVSGSGPGFYYDSIKNYSRESEWKNYAEINFIPVLAAIAEEKGFSRDQAQLLAKVTAQGSFELLQATGLSPRDLCLRVASPGGTTAEGLSVLHNNGNLHDAVEAARRQAEKLEREIRFI